METVYDEKFYQVILYALRPSGRQKEFRIGEIQTILLSEKDLDRSKYQIRNALEDLVNSKKVKRTVPDPRSTTYSLR